MRGKEAQAGEGNFIKWFSELNAKDEKIAGSKGAFLGEMYNNKFPVPPGFVITTDLLKYLLEKNNLDRVISDLARKVNLGDRSEPQKTSLKIRTLIENLEFPDWLSEEIMEAYYILDGSEEADVLGNSKRDVKVAVRSSCFSQNNTGFDSFLNISGKNKLLDSIKKVLSSAYSKDSIANQNLESSMGVIIQKMIDSGKGGIITSENNGSDRIVIEAIFGLGNGLKSKEIASDKYFMDHELNIIGQKIANKRIALTSGIDDVEEVELPNEIRKREVLTGHEIKMLGHYAQRLGEHFGRPQDVEFSISNGEIFIVDSKPAKIRNVSPEFDTQQDKTSEIRKESEIPRKEHVDEEDLILRALDEDEIEREKHKKDVIPMSELEEMFKGADEYNPSVKDKKGDIPSLNDAIPVSIKDFKESDNNSMLSFMDVQEEMVFEEEVKEEIAESEQREAMKKEILSKAQGGQGQNQEESNQVSDIF